MKRAELSRMPPEMNDAAEKLQCKLYEATHVLIPRTQCLRIYLAISDVNDAKLNRFAQWIRSNKKAARTASYLNLKC